MRKSQNQQTVIERSNLVIEGAILNHNKTFTERNFKMYSQGLFSHKGLQRKQLDTNLDKNHNSLNCRNEV